MKLVNDELLTKDGEPVVVTTEKPVLEAPFDISTEPYKVANFATIFNLIDNEDILVKEYGDKMRGEESVVADINPRYAARIDQGQLVLDYNVTPIDPFEWVKSAREQIHFLTRPSSIYSQHVPKTHVVLGGKKESPKVYLATEKVEGTELDPNNSDFLKHIEEFSDFIDLTLTSIQTQFQAGDKIIRIPDIFTFDIEHITAKAFRFQNFTHGSIKHGKEGLYLTDVYPLHLWESKSKREIFVSYQNAVESLNKVLFEKWWSEQNQSQLKITINEKAFVRWYGNGRNIEDAQARAQITNLDAFWLNMQMSDFYYENHWGKGNDFEQQEYSVWFLQKKRLDDRIKSYFSGTKTSIQV
ncbi:MAG: hypothetical protein AAB612_00345 [Patescibacteria group bacterium]